ncbi:glycerate kinase [Luteococcus sp.]|uniref:glycerate kinase n=1 Tax=Luteococcus sp. TaxID=1969402 RepID=UPI0026483006|nr:glycerate kinase [Luteococcus sp.]
MTGALGDGAEVLYDEGFAAIFPVLCRLAPLDEVLADGATNISRTARNIGAVLSLGAVRPSA